MKNKKEKGIMDFARNYKYLTYLGCVLSGINSVLALMPFVFIFKIAYEVLKVYPNIKDAKNLSYYGWLAVLFSLASIVIYFCALMCTHTSAFRISRNMKTEALEHIVKLPLGYFEENGSGKIRRIINEASEETEIFLAHMLPDFTGAIVTPIAMVVLLFIFDWRLGLISLLPIIIGIYFCNAMMGKDLANSMKEYQNALDNMNNEAVEYVRGIPVVKTFGQSIFSFKNFYNSINNYKKWAVSYTIRLRKPMCKFTVSINGVFALLISAGIILIASCLEPRKFISDFIFYVIFTPIITVVMNKIMFSSEDLMLAKDAASRINSILNEKVLEESNSNRIPSISDIEFKNVDFTYNGSKIKAIDNISFTVKQGTKVAIVGPSGGGKSTIASLMPRFYDVDNGEISIGGINVKNIKNKNLMNLVSFVFQNSKLFKGTLLDNILFSKPNATMEEVMKAAKFACCDEFVSKMPNGYNTVIGENGSMLSGGERQRLSIARALLKDAPIILLDEATASLDVENESKVQEALSRLIKNKTVLVVAHRMRTIQEAEHIVVLKDGKVSEEGTHNELMNNDGVYNRLWNLQMKSSNWKIS